MIEKLRFNSVQSFHFALQFGIPFCMYVMAIKKKMTGTKQKGLNVFFFYLKFVLLNYSNI